MSASDLQRDGRIQRSARSRAAIVGALYELVGEGNLRPTAQEVAERAGVGIRTVFRHFSDMDSLYAEMDARLLETLAPLMREDPGTGTVAERARGLVARRVEAFEIITPYMRAGRVQRWNSPFLEERMKETTRNLRRDLSRWLPEIDAAPADLAAALELATSFEAWDRLRSEQRLGPQRAREATERTVLLLAEKL